jgi:hypothetical protein
LAILGIFTGVVDASIDDFTVKAFVWTGFIMLFFGIISYEFIVMPTPPRPRLQAFLFIIFGFMGFLSYHHFTWYVLAMLLGKLGEGPLWLMPHVYVDLLTYTIVMFSFMGLYAIYLYYINYFDCST